MFRYSPAVTVYRYFSAGLECTYFEFKVVSKTLISLKFNVNPDIKYIAALACIFGHCYPIFAEFRGGKAVSTSLGYFLCIEPLYAVVAIVVFLLVLKISKYVSLSSISTALIVLCITPFLAVSITAKLCMLVAVILLVYRHKDNIKRIKNQTESKIQWM